MLEIEFNTKPLLEAMRRFGWEMDSLTYDRLFGVGGA